MSEIRINYNPYTLRTDITIDGSSVDDTSLVYVKDKRLQEWIEPRGQWEGIFQELRKVCNERTIRLSFYGTSYDFEDMLYASKRYGEEIFDEIDLEHENKESANSGDQNNKIEELKKLYQELLDGPVEELKSPEILKRFENAINSDFEIVVVAPMSSGKSTLINSILGKDLLPAVNKATTAVITRIRDNDEATDFTVTCSDKYGNCICENEIATKEKISELNYKKDPADEKGEQALINKMFIEGPIKSLPSDKLNTVFVDTPGGNNAQNKEHEDMMDRAINDENKSLILCVINGETPTTNDADGILAKISNAIRQSMNGKQSRDRFIFVANKFDAVDPTLEPYEDYIKSTILPELAKHGITEPNLFLASADAAKLIRMSNDGQELTSRENRRLDSYIEQYNEDEENLTDYSSLVASKKEKLANEIRELKQKNDEEAQIRIAEICSGVPAIEEAIKHYLEKYALAIKINNAHQSFMRKVKEIDTLNKCEKKWSSSKKEYDKIRKELEEKLKEYKNTSKVKETIEEISAIKIPLEDVYVEFDKITAKITKLGNSKHKKIKKDSAETVVAEIRDSLEDALKKSSNDLLELVNRTVVQNCNDILNKYNKIVKSLDERGLFEIGGANLKQFDKMPKIKIETVEEMLSDDAFIEVKNEFLYTRTYEKSGFWNGVKRFFGASSGWGSEDVYGDVEYVDVSKLIADRVGEILLVYDKEFNNIISRIENAIDTIKTETKNKLIKADEVISETLTAIDKKTRDEEVFKKKVEENREKYEWVQNFIEKVEKILEI